MQALIMAGGAGTRFWPRSRIRRPKQLLPIAGAASMIRTTFERLLPLVPPAQILVVTRAEQEHALRDELPELPPANLLVEPTGRNTAACIALAAAVLRARGVAATEPMLVLPSDHAIAKEAAFRAVLAAAERVLQTHDVLLTLGIQPSRPETGYGYIRRGEPAALVGETTFHRVERFVEKPDLDLAQRLAADGAHLWNSGMFLWRLGRIQAELERHVPALGEALRRLQASYGTSGWDAALEETYRNAPSLSIDYGVMERAAAVWVAAVDLGWSDVGTWASLAEVRPRDEAGNVLPRGSLAVAASGNVVDCTGRTVVLLGVSDLIVVDSEDALLVCHRDRAQEVGEIPERLRRRGQGSLT
jgi:mannose-1-phosphate guanylyltransferase